MDILVSRTLYMSCQAGPGLEPGPSALKASALPIELTWQTWVVHVVKVLFNAGDVLEMSVVRGVGAVSFT